MNNPAYVGNNSPHCRKGNQLQLTQLAPFFSKKIFKIDFFKMFVKRAVSHVSKLRGARSNYGPSQRSLSTTLLRHYPLVSPPSHHFLAPPLLFKLRPLFTFPNLGQLSSQWCHANTCYHQIPHFFFFFFFFFGGIFKNHRRPVL